MYAYYNTLPYKGEIASDRLNRHFYLPDTQFTI